MMLATIILVAVLVAWALIGLAALQERNIRTADASSLAALHQQAQAEAKAQSGALADLPPWRTLQPQADHAFLGAAAWKRLSEWGDTIELGLQSRHAKDQAAPIGTGRRRRQQWEACVKRECSLLLRGYEVNARLVHHIRSVLQHEADTQAGAASELAFVRQLAHDRLFVELLQARVASEASMQGWNSERLSLALGCARKDWSASASCTTSPARFINTVLRLREL